MLHNDGAYLQDPPRIVVLYCAIAAKYGGETVLADTVEVYKSLSGGGNGSEALWTIRTRVGPHAAERQLVVPHPRTGARGVFFFDPAVGGDSEVTVDGRALSKDFLKRLRNCIWRSGVFLFHKWSAHDLLVFDNYRVMHGRMPFVGDRCLYRLHIDDSDVPIE